MKFLVLALTTLLAATVSNASPTENSDPLVSLFEELVAADGEFEIFSAETRIRERWAMFDGDTVTLLMERGRIAYAQSEYEIAEGHFTDVAQLEPNFVDVWFQLANVSKQTDDYDQAARYLRTVVTLEPRHFDAWIMLAEIMTEVGNKNAAYKAYQQALEVHPHLEDAKLAIKALRPDVEGRGI